MTTVIKLSPQQTAFLDWIKNGVGSCVLIAVAGAGKTFSLVKAIELLKGSTAVLAFNKKIADEIGEKIAHVASALAGTVHSFGFRALGKAYGKIKVDGYKVNNLVQDLILNDRPDLKPYEAAIVKLVGYAKQRALGVIGSIDDDSAWFDIIVHFDVFADVDEDEENPIPQEEVVRVARLILNKSNKITNVVDFDDMVYLPTFLNVPMNRFDNVLVDEAQDTNAARRALVRALLKPNGRLVAVGDPCQAIYGFTGADNDSLDLIKRDFDAIELPLIVTYRCPKAVVSFAQQWVSHIEAAETAPEGSVGNVEMVDFMARKDLDGSSVVLCRLTAPIVELAFKLIRQRVPCKVEGRDVGKSLEKLATRWKVKNTADLIDKLIEWKETEKTKLLARKQETKAQHVDDTVETLLVIIENVNAEGKHSIKDVVTAIDGLFADGEKKILTLSTIHKSKGREWKNVFWYDRISTCPSKYARQAWQKDQERNLMYVAATRAKANLFDLAKLPKVA